ncbi:MAG: alpha-ketoacid dehydrogenase subunit beta [Patescibacteria group bacterium]
MSNLIMVEALNLALKQEMKKDPSVLLIGEDVGIDGGVFRVSDGLINQFGKERVIDTPLSESGIIGAGIGLALSGMKPICEIQFSGFIYSGLEQLISHAARMRWRSRGRFTCPMVIRAPNGGGVKALEHHSEAMEAIFGAIQGLKVVMPATPYDAKGLLISAIRDPDPVLFLEPMRVYRAFREEVPEEEYTIPIGKAAVVNEGSDVTVVTWGAMRWLCEKVISAHGDKASIELIDLRTISPMDFETILASVQKTGRCVIVQEGSQSFGVAAEISARLMEKCLLNLQAPVERVTSPDVPPPYLRGEMLTLPSEERIWRAIEKVLNF